MLQSSGWPGWLSVHWNEKQSMLWRVASPLAICFRNGWPSFGRWYLGLMRREVALARMLCS